MVNSLSKSQYRIRIKPEVDVYQVAEHTALFSDRLKTITVEVKSGKKKLMELINKLDSGVSIRRLANLFGIEKRERSEEIVFSLMSCGLFEIYTSNDDDDSGNESENNKNRMWHDFLRHGIYSPKAISETVKSVLINIIAPNHISNTIYELFSKYNFECRNGERTFSKEKILKINILESVKHRYNIHILYLCDVDEQYISEIAKGLALKKSLYVPIHTDQSSPIVVGPLVDQTGPCLQCYISRLQGGRLNPEVTELLSNPDIPCLRRGQKHHTPHELNLISSVIFVLVSRYILGTDIGPSNAKRKYYRINSLNMSVREFSLFKVPHCPACSSTRFMPGRQEFVPRKLVI